MLHMYALFWLKPSLLHAFHDLKVLAIGSNFDCDLTW
jgi:hypothetical protein